MNKDSFRFLHLLICCVCGKDDTCLIFDLVFFNNSIWRSVNHWSDKLIIFVACICITTGYTDDVSLVDSSRTCFLNFCCFGLSSPIVASTSIFKKWSLSFCISFSYVFFAQNFLPWCKKVDLNFKTKRNEKSLTT